MSLLSIVQTAAVRIGIPKPPTVIGNNNPQVMQLLELANMLGDEMTNRFEWSFQVKQKQTTMNTDTPAVIGSGVDNMEYIVKDQLYDMTTRLKIFRVSPEEVLEAKITNKWYRDHVYYIENVSDQILLKLYPENIPATAPHTVHYLYKTKDWVMNGATSVQRFVADTDTILFNEFTFTLGLIANFKMAKGLEYAEFWDKHERAIAADMAQDAGSSVVSTSCEVLYPESKLSAPYRVIV